MSASCELPVIGRLVSVFATLSLFWLQIARFFSANSVYTRAYSVHCKMFACSFFSGGSTCRIWRAILEHRYQNKWMENAGYKPPPPGGEIKGPPGGGDRRRAMSQSAVTHLPPRGRPDN